MGPHSLCKGCDIFQTELGLQRGACLSCYSSRKIPHASSCPEFMCLPNHRQANKTKPLTAHAYKKCHISVLRTMTLVINLYRPLLKTFLVHRMNLQPDRPLLAMFLWWPEHVRKLEVGLYLRLPFPPSLWGYKPSQFPWIALFPLHQVRSSACREVQVQAVPASSLHLACLCPFLSLWETTWRLSALPSPSD